MTLYTHYDLNLHTDRRFRPTQFRHAVRKVYRKMGMTINEIQLLELKETGKCPHHSTVIHSCRIADVATVKVVEKLAKALRLQSRTE